ncbi:hypothetical protein F3157_00860 [Virgibacillus dakarensis]|uniref:LiaI-LiaF-like transmembrane region domain-containing protein n=1 Tax=Lentibacillus populi TaxID=1827502 RepID=A0A9W5X3R4_9BACI|nr:DUF5668 domain-containing protein [Lentibacillus populi]MBT2215169.1 hypothetical protein [Virgibacillus dakarensis]MTW84221.1 hypothetical protein [Virgibacillus dakarensis]GGB28069.1 hypothetical protein GCM10011409_01790 [Lentibacillus populi]
MKKQNSFAGYLLIGIGGYFLLRELKVPIITDFYSWTTLLIIIGLALLIHSYSSKDYQNLFVGTIILGLGIHFHGMNHYAFWIDHWAVYPLIVGIAFIVRSLKTKKGLLPGVILIGGSLLLIFSIQLPAWFNWIYIIVDYLESYWPIAIIIIGIFLLKRKK